VEESVTIGDSAKLARELSPVESELMRQEKLVEVLRSSVLGLGEKLNPILANNPENTTDPSASDSHGSSSITRAISHNNNSIESIITAVVSLTRGVEV
jgi:hypothetical protein